MTNELASTGTVVQLIGSFGGGGAQRLALNLAAALGDRNVRSVAIAMRDAGGFADAGSQNGVEVRSLGLTGGDAFSACKSIVRLRSLIREMSPSVVHVHGSSCLIAAAAAVCGLRHKPRLVFTWHDSGSVVSTRLTRRVPTVWALKRCDVLLGSSRDVSRRLDAAIGAEGRASVFVNGVPLTDATGAAADSEASVVWAGRLVPEKDPESLLRCIGQLVESGHRVSATLAGGSLPRHAEYGASVRALHERLELENVVSMPGWIDDIGALYRHANIGVQTSRTEGLSMSLLEMMMAGLAIIATDVGDTATAIEHGRSGFIVPPGDDEKFLDAMTKLVSNQALRQRLGSAARARALQVFSTDAMAERAIDIYGLNVSKRAKA